MQTDGYTWTTCYNLRCAGFIQTNPSIVFEGVISPTSTLGGAQTELTIQIWKVSENFVSYFVFFCIFSVSNI